MTTIDCVHFTLPSNMGTLMHLTLKATLNDSIIDLSDSMASSGDLIGMAKLLKILMLDGRNK